MCAGKLPMQYVALPGLCIASCRKLKRSQPFSERETFFLAIPRFDPCQWADLYAVPSFTAESGEVNQSLVNELRAAPLSRLRSSH
jgi:hypothetical protein